MSAFKDTRPLDSARTDATWVQDIAFKGEDLSSALGVRLAAVRRGSTPPAGFSLSVGDGLLPPTADLACGVRVDVQRMRSIAPGVYDLVVYFDRVDGVTDDAYVGWIEIDQGSADLLAHPGLQPTSLAGGQRGPLLVDRSATGGTVWGGSSLGLTGPAGTIDIASVTLLPPGSAPTVENVGTPENAELAIGLPAGAPGAPGPPGDVTPQAQAAADTATAQAVVATAQRAAVDAGLAAAPYSLDSGDPESAHVFTDAANRFLGRFDLDTRQWRAAVQGPIRYASGIALDEVDSGDPEGPMVQLDATGLEAGVTFYSRITRARLDAQAVQISSIAQSVAFAPTSADSGDPPSPSVTVDSVGALVPTGGVPDAQATAIATNTTGVAAAKARLDVNFDAAGQQLVGVMNPERLRRIKTLLGMLWLGETTAADGVSKLLLPINAITDSHYNRSIWRIEQGLRKHCSNKSGGIGYCRLFGGAGAPSIPSGLIRVAGAKPIAMSSDVFPGYPGPGVTISATGTWATVYDGLSVQSAGSTATGACDSAGLTGGVGSAGDIVSAKVSSNIEAQQTLYVWNGPASGKSVRWRIRANSDVSNNVPWSAPVALSTTGVTLLASSALSPPMQPGYTTELKCETDGTLLHALYGLSGHEGVILNMFSLSGSGAVYDWNPGLAGPVAKAQLAFTAAIATLLKLDANDASSPVPVFVPAMAGIVSQVRAALPGVGFRGHDVLVGSTAIYPAASNATMATFASAMRAWASANDCAYLNHQDVMGDPSNNDAFSLNDWHDDKHYAEPNTDGGVFRSGYGKPAVDLQILRALLYSA